MAETTGTGQAATARHTSSVLHGRSDGPSPPPRARMTTSTPGRATTAPRASTMATEAARTGHGGLLEVQRVAGKAGRRHRLDVLAHGRIGAAHHPDHRRQDRERPAGPVEQTLGRQPAAGLGDQLGDGALADRRDLLGHQVHLAAVVGPLQDAHHAHPLAVDGPAAADVARRAP